MDIISYVLARKYTDETAIQFGGLKGANCTIKSIVHQDGVNTITFEWTNDQGDKRTSQVEVFDGTPIYDWTAGDHYKYGDLAIYSAAFYRCIVENSDTVFDSTKWSEIGNADSQYDIVENSSQLPPRFTEADKRLYYSIEDEYFWLWNGHEWVLQDIHSISNDDIMALFA